MVILLLLFRGRQAAWSWGRRVQFPAEVCAGGWGDRSLGACLEEALGIGLLEEGKG